MFKWSLWQTIKHQFFDCLQLIGLRDRLRCPECKAVGTWKPHGGWFDGSPADRALVERVVREFGARKAPNRRWLCKYCGFNLSTEGQFWCCPDDKTKVWCVKERAEKPTLTPKERVGPNVWPWRG